MRPVQLMRRFSSPAFLRDLNTALWIAPFLNGDTIDAGWSCRDHAWVVSMVCLAEGVSACTIHGVAGFVGTSTASGTRLSVVLEPHAWVAGQQVGFCDLSVKPEYPDPIGGGGIPLATVIGNRFVGGIGNSVYVAKDRQDFYRAMEAAAVECGGTCAVYLGLEYDRITPLYVNDAAKWINSPLTEWLKARYGRANYAGLALHLRGLVAGTRLPLAKSDQGELWGELETGFASADSQLLRVVAPYLT